MNMEYSEDRQTHADEWWLLVVLGLLLVLAGIAALTVPFLASVAAAFMFGWILILGGVLHGVHAFRTRRRGSLLLGLLIAVLYVIAGIYLLAYPLVGVATLTLVLGWLLVVNGVLKLAAGWSLRGSDRVWMAINGILTLILGIVIVASWPQTALWVIGLFLGVDLFLTGITLIAAGFALRQMMPPLASRPA